MSKDKDQKKPPVKAETTEIAASPATVVEVTEPVATAALVKTEEAALEKPSVIDPVAAALAKRIPHKAEDLLLLERPTIAEMLASMGALNPAQQAALKQLIKKTNPKKQGMHTDRGGFSPTELRLYQGTGSDPLLPPDMIPGHLYTGESKALKPPVKMAVLGAWTGRILWPPKGAGGGGDATQKNSKMPVCISFDRKVGSKYGDCASCPFADKPYNQDGCAKEIGLFLIDEGLTTIFELRLSKTSEGAGSGLLKAIGRFDAPWSRWVEVGAEKREAVKDGKNARWYVWSLKAGSEAVSPELNTLFTQFSQMLDLDVFFPRLADVYERKATTGQSGTGPKGETADLGTLTGGGAPDYSDESGPSV